MALESAQDGVGVTVRSADPESDEVELGGRDTADRSLVALSQARFFATSGRHVVFWLYAIGQLRTDRAAGARLVTCAFAEA